MQISPEQLDAHLGKSLAPLYAVTGTEELRALESADAIRAHAKAAGFTDRKVYSAGAHFDWGQIKADLAGMSLFGDKPLIDLRIPSGKPGTEGSAALTGKPGKEGGAALDGIAALAKANAGGALLLVTFPGDYQTMKTAWVKALDAAGVLIESKPMDASALPAWIGERLARQKQSAAPETLRFIAAKVEGNLIAAHQEIMKLALMHPAGKLAHEAVEEAVLNVARYDVFKLSDAWLSGDLPRFRRMLEGLRGEGEAPPLILWAMADDIRALAKLRRGEKVWKGPRSSLYERKAKNVSNAQLGAALKHAAGIDALIKGLRPRALSSDVWEEFYRLGESFA